MGNGKALGPLAKLRTHFQQGTIVSLLRSKVLGLGRTLNAVSKPRSFNRFTVRTENEAITLLVRYALQHHQGRDGAAILLVDDGSDLTSRLELELATARMRIVRVSLARLDSLAAGDLEGVVCVIAGFIGMRAITFLGRKLLDHRTLSALPFEYVSIPSREYRPLEIHDEYRSTDFVSPLITADFDAFAIYERSLASFEKKCAIRDFMDLAQLISWVVRCNVRGDLAEFGSFKGHSGYLISELLKEFQSEKRLYMFDMFEAFPEEELGVDAFWQGTHSVDFDSVRAKFESRTNVTLVKGDFTQTLAESGVGDLCLAYVDCDSYRGTKYLIETLFEQHLSTNGVLVLEDYGHGPLLGNRLAFHEYFDSRLDCFRFFSQFSGFQFVVKTRFEPVGEAISCPAQ